MLGVAVVVTPQDTAKALRICSLNLPFLAGSPRIYTAFAALYVLSPGACYRLTSVVTGSRRFVASQSSCSVVVTETGVETKYSRGWRPIPVDTRTVTLGLAGAERPVQLHEIHVELPLLGAIAGVLVR